MAENKLAGLSTEFAVRIEYMGAHFKPLTESCRRLRFFGAVGQRRRLRSLGGRAAVFMIHFSVFS